MGSKPIRTDRDGDEYPSALYLASYTDLQSNEGIFGLET